MTTRNLKENITVSQSINPGAKTATSTGTAVDIGANESATVVFVVGTITDGTHVPSITECATSGGSYTTVAASDLSGTLANLASNTPQRVGYMGKLGFIKAVVTVTGATTGGVYGANVILGHPKNAPTA